MDLTEWTELARRLLIPGFEEARLYFPDAAIDGQFDGANEIWPYLASNLSEVIQRYAQQG